MVTFPFWFVIWTPVTHLNYTNKTKTNNKRLASYPPRMTGSCCYYYNQRASVLCECYFILSWNSQDLPSLRLATLSKLYAGCAKWLQTLFYMTTLCLSFCRLSVFYLLSSNIGHFSDSFVHKSVDAYFSRSTIRSQLKAK